MARVIKILSALMIVGFIGFAIHLYFGNPEDKQDSLCSLAKKDFNMNCSILAAPGVYEKGAVVNIAAAPAGEISKIGFPVQQIFGSSCLVGPAAADFSTFKEQPGQSVVFGKREISVDRSLSAGAKLNIPEAASFDLQGGPNISDVRSIVLNADSAQVFTINQTAAQDALNACTVRAACTKGISSNQAIVTRLLVAKNLQYSVKDKNGAVFPLAVAAEKGLVSVGLRAGREVVSTTDLSSGKDMVFAVETSAPTQFDFTTCRSSLKMLKVTGHAKAKAVTNKNVIDEHESPNDGEAGAHVRYTLPDTERQNESIMFGEAFANSKWTVAPDGARIFLDSNVFAIPGTRWPMNDATFKRTYAPSAASTELALDVALVSRDDTSKQLVVVMNINFGNNRDVPLFQTLSELSVTGGDGSSRNIPAIWKSGEEHKEFDLGKIEPGDITHVKLTRPLNLVADVDRDGGRFVERLTVSFELR
jgi:hypothetical protein